jgi:hypothetical protein
MKTINPPGPTRGSGAAATAQARSADARAGAASPPRGHALPTLLLVIPGPAVLLAQGVVLIWATVL